MEYTIKPVAKIITHFDEKFGIPRQGQLAAKSAGTIVFEPQYRNPDALRGIEGFSHLWLLWVFSENVAAVDRNWLPLIRPPRLGGNAKVGVFASRSPFRPNNIGISCVKFEGLEETPDNGTVIHVSGVDMMNGTPIVDIKPYVPYTDSFPEALSGFVSSPEYQKVLLSVTIPEEIKKELGEELAEELSSVLSLDPRPAYQNDPERIYGMFFAGYNVLFKADSGSVTVTGLERRE
ncbi:MAG: tRNA (N6-threonylcarbamoyladenosine(37)-N6)-methyltransferase TrmO [Lachnospiraceae bacterium]|nr:tRNA (N6-threonylcarbamoyladenosine(37)-N6)-methyltransferase TrmO [Lachnospiraceae bacterium]